MESGGVSLQPAEQVVKPLFFNTTGVNVAHLQAPWPLQSDVQHGYRVGPKSVLVLASSILLVWSHSAIINSVGECGLCNQVKLARKKMERRKVRERQALCRRSGWSFSPFVIKANGVRSGKANQLLQKLVTVSTNNNGCSKRKASFLCRSRLQLALVRGLARQLERGFPL